jgi:hypothetical protein
MTRWLNVAVVALVVVLLALGFGNWMAARAPHIPPTLLDYVRGYIGRQYHDCIPLGWYAQRGRWGTYYPAVNLDATINDTPFQALWVGIVPPARTRDPRVAEVRSVMDQLVDAGLLRRSDDPRGVRYNLTRYGERFFYQDDDVTGNVEDWPYVCYTRLRVTRIAWDPPRPGDQERGPAITKHVRVWWQTEPITDWPTPALRQHAVQLRPAASPAVATVCSYVDGEWAIFPFETNAAGAAKWRDLRRC